MLSLTSPPLLPQQARHPPRREARVWQGWLGPARQRGGPASVTGWGSGTCVPALLLWGGERARKRFRFPIGTPESHHPPILSHTSQCTAHSPPRTSRAAGETPLTEGQPARQSPGRPFVGRATVSTPGAPGAARKQPQGQLPDTCPLEEAQSPPAWDPAYGCPPSPYGVLPLRPSSLAVHLWALLRTRSSAGLSALGSPSGPVDITSLAPGSPPGVGQPRPPSLSTPAPGSAPSSCWQPLLRHCGEQQLCSEKRVGLPPSLSSVFARNFGMRQKEAGPDQTVARDSGRIF